ncbi:sensor histidine kinase [Massilia niastensis]|uniref:sensor histidine kinase n=1 Tax=Massilia niastensis TaxID=544911 RepID=UPI00039A42A8|nr:histidine kinase [Massilia niastensis]
MWGKFWKWWRAWEEEQLAVLQQPSLAAHAPEGYRRYFACKLAALSPIERQELHRFSVTYRGRRLILALLKLCLVSSLAGAVLKLAFLPNLPWPHTMFGANAVGLAMVMALTTVWFNYPRIARHKLRTFAAVVGLALAGGLFGSAVAMFEKGESWEILLDRLPRIVATVTLVPGLLFAGPLIVLAVMRNRHYETLTARLQRDAEQERLARELSESQLRLLRAQIEPHFLFNTLGAVQQLAEQGAPRAAELTANLIDFLRASMSDMRCEQVSLKAEFRLVESYLRVMQTRMGERLHLRIDLPSALEGICVPSMIVLTLAENAIKHGIEPSLRGGEVDVSAEGDADRVRIRVRDSGVGMSDTPGAGMGLENIRQRLRLAYGDGAGLALSEADPGLVAEILIPCKEAR